MEIPLECNLPFLSFSDIGVHLDGFISLLGHTVILTNSTIDGKRADALACAQTCLDVAGKMLIDGTTVFHIIFNI